MTYISEVLSNSERIIFVSLGMLYVNTEGRLFFPNNIGLVGFIDFLHF